jgi:glycosyltransferase involved in cell wall biosynthesis
MRISILCPDLSSNAMARTCPIAQVLSRDHEIEIVGFDPGEGFFEPYEDEFDYTAFPVDGNPVSLYRNVRRAQRRITGDVCYAFRPMMGSLGVGLLHKRRTGTPLVLDVEDIVRFKQHPLYRKAYNSLVFSGSPTAGVYAVLLERLLHSVDAVTVTSTHLQDRYGGNVLPYGPDAEAFRPDVAPPSDLPAYEGALLVFVGTVRPHKGLDLLGAALSKMENEATLLVAGYDPHDQLEKIDHASGGRVQFVGPIDHEAVPSYLAAADIVAIPQRDTPYTVAQVPNKLFEAMAMGKPIVATRVGDMPRLLDGCGRIVDPDPGSIASSLDELIDHPERADTLGDRARNRYLNEYARPVLRSRLNTILEDVTAGTNSSEDGLET